MAVKTHEVFLQILIIYSMIWRNECQNNTIIDCKCDQKPNQCYQWVNEKTCALMNGKLNGEDECRCCPVCVIRRKYLESCHQSIPGFKVFCAEHLFCSKKYGLVCIDLQQKIIRHRMKIFDEPKNPYEDKLISLVPERQRPLKRVPRMQFKGRNKYRDK